VNKPYSRRLRKHNERNPRQGKEGPSDCEEGSANEPGIAGGLGILGTSGTKKSCNQGHNPHTGVRIGEAGNPGPKEGRKSGVAGPRKKGRKGTVKAQEGSPSNQTAVEQVEEVGEFLQHTTEKGLAEGPGGTATGDGKSEAAGTYGDKEDIFWAPLGSDFEDHPGRAGEVPLW
jgi:hypothetical protein